MTPPTPANDDFEITLERGACFFNCPIYSVTIAADGGVTYVGTNFVRVSGEQHATIPRAEVTRLAALVERARFFDLKDNYQGQMTDRASERITVRRHGRTKSVREYVGEEAGMPHAVTELELAIDHAAHTEQWVWTEEELRNTPH